MKKTIDNILKWGTFAAFIGAAVAGYWNLQEFKAYKASRIQDRNAIDSNTAVVTKVLNGQNGILQWMGSHNTRHEDHKEQHAAERGN
jgi:hypothetical protein